MAQSTFFPDADPETNSVDGWVAVPGNDIWDTVRPGSGFSPKDSTALIETAIIAHSGTDNWKSFDRGLVFFDTSSIDNADVVSAAILSLFIKAVASDDFASTLCVVRSTSASVTSLTTADGELTNIDTTLQSNTPATLAGLSIDAYKDMTLNETGRGNIDKSGVTRLCTMISDDAEDNEPTWASNSKADLNYSSADGGGPTEGPRLVVTHVPESALTVTRTFEISL